MTPAGKVVLALAAVTATVGIVMALRSRARRHNAAWTPDEDDGPQPNFVDILADLADDQAHEADLEAPAFSVSGLIVDDDGIRPVQNWNQWLSFMPKALRQARALGMKTGDEILTYALRISHPDRTWPPPLESPVFVDWQALVYVIQSTLDPEPSPQPQSNPSRTQPRLHVV